MLHTRLPRGAILIPINTNKASYMVDDLPQGTQLEVSDLGSEPGLSNLAWRAQQWAEDRLQVVPAGVELGHGKELTCIWLGELRGLQGKEERGVPVT